MNATQKIIVTTLLTTRGFLPSQAACMVAFMDDMTDDECMVALRAHGLDRTDAKVLMDDVQEIMDALKPVPQPVKPARKAARKAAPKLMDGAKADLEHEMMRESEHEWTAEEILKREA